MHLMTANANVWHPLAALARCLQQELVASCSTANSICGHRSQMWCGDSVRVALVHCRGINAIMCLLHVFNCT